MADELRARIKIALTRQPTERSAAINGDPSTIQPMAFFARKVAPEWLDEMLTAELYREHPDTADGVEPKGVLSMSFHEWVAGLVITVDPAFDHGAHHQSRSKNARAIQQALAVWVADEKKEEQADEDEDRVIDIST